LKGKFLSNLSFFFYIQLAVNQPPPAKKKMQSDKYIFD